MEFNEIKSRIIDWCKENSACEPEFKRILASETDAQILKVITDNWRWSWKSNFTVELLRLFSNEAMTECSVYICDEEKMYETEKNSFVFSSGNSTVMAYGNSTVEAYGNSTVMAYGNSTVMAYGNSTVMAYGNSTVMASIRATINSYNKNGHEVNDFSVCRYIESGDVIKMVIGDSAKNLSWS